MVSSPALLRGPHRSRPAPLLRSLLIGAIAAACSVASGAAQADVSAEATAISTSGPIGAAYAALGSSMAVLGEPVSPQFTSAAGGAGQHFAFGSIYWSPASGAPG